VHAKKSAKIICINPDFSEGVVFVARGSHKKTCAQVADDWIDENTNRKTYEGCMFRIEEE
jgi:hypothetical protein